MITITRRFASDCRSFFQRAMGLSARGPLPTVSITAGPNGLSIRSRNERAALEFRTGGHYEVDSLELPFAVLVDCQGKDMAGVALKRNSSGLLEAQWYEGSVPRQAEYQLPKAAKSPSPIAQRCFWRTQLRCSRRS